MFGEIFGLPVGRPGCHRVLPPPGPPESGESSVKNVASILCALSGLVREFNLLAPREHLESRHGPTPSTELPGKAQALDRGKPRGLGAHGATSEDPVQRKEVPRVAGDISETGAMRNSSARSWSAAPPFRGEEQPTEWRP